MKNWSQKYNMYVLGLLNGYTAISCTLEEYNSLKEEDKVGEDYYIISNDDNKVVKKKSIRGILKRDRVTWMNLGVYRDNVKIGIKQEKLEKKEQSEAEKLLAGGLDFSVSDSDIRFDDVYSWEVK